MGRRGWPCRRARDRAERLRTAYRSVRLLNRLVEREDDRPTILRQTCEELVQPPGYASARIVLVSGEGAAAGAGPDGRPEPMPVFARGDRRMLAPCLVEAMKGRGVRVFERGAEACRRCPGRAGENGAAALGVSLERDGRIHGVLHLVLPPGAPPTEEETRLVGDLAEDVTLALEHLERRASCARLECEGSLLAQVVEAATEAVIIADAEAGVRYVNPAFERLTGFSRRESVGRRPPLFGEAGRDGDPAGVLWQAVRRGEAWSGRLASRRRDGSRWEAELAVSPIRDSSNRVINSIAILRDVTGEAALEAQFRQAQRMEPLGRLAGGIAHDFNNQLTIIQGYCGLVLHQMAGEDPLRPRVQSIQRAAERSASLVRRLLGLGRSDGAGDRPTDLGPVLAGLADPLARVLGRDVRLSCAAAEGLKPVRVDPALLEQAILNLATNARDAMPGGGRLAIEAALVRVAEGTGDRHGGAPPGPYVTLSVTDTGVGMDEETLGRIFDPFFTTKPEGKGTGLGMPMVQRFVKQSRGYVAVESRPGAGTTVRLYFPAAELPTGSAPTASAGGAGRS